MAYAHMTESSVPFKILHILVSPGILKIRAYSEPVAESSDPTSACALTALLSLSVPWSYTDKNASQT